MIKDEFKNTYKEAYTASVLLDRHKKGEKMFSFEFIERADLTTYCWTRATVCTYYSKATKSVRIISYIKNIQDEKNEQYRLNHLAYNDSLTKVLNIGGFLNSINTMVIKEDSEACLFLLDLDNFKQINDVLGHQTGDLVLFNVADKLKKIFSQDDIIGRLGGDEFVVLVKKYSNIEELKIKAQSVCDLIKKTYNNDEESVDISASVGVSFAPLHNDCFNILYKNADIELYKAKKNGKNQYSIGIK